MPRFFFHIRNGNDYVADEEGTEVANLAAAEEEASEAAREILAERLLNGEVLDGQTFEIVDEDGRILKTVPFRSVIRQG
jgi:hypothetical protein